MPISLKRTIQNIPSSGARFVGDVASAITHPVQTIAGVGNVALGGLQKLEPGRQPQEQAFEQAYKFFKDRYGSTRSITRTLEEDPVGFIADVSTLLTGAGGAVRGGVAVGAKVGATGTRAAQIGRVGSAIQKAGTFTEPIGLAARGTALAAKFPLRGAQRLGAAALGVSTGVGEDVLREAFRAGRRLSPEFTQALRGTITQESLLSGAREGLHVLKDIRANQYITQLNKLKTVSKTVDISSLKGILDRQVKQFGVKRADGVLDFSRSTISDVAEQGRVGALLDIIQDWGTRRGDRTVIGLDVLKRRLDDFYSPSRQARAITTSVSTEVKKILGNNFPEYTQMTRKYAEASDIIKDIESSLSLGGRADVAIGKLTKILKQDNEFRKTLVKTLDDATGKDLMAQIAGSSLSPIVPSGLVGRNIFAGILGVGWLVNPNMWLGLAGTSPRLVGEFLRAAGVSVTVVEKILTQLNKMGVFSTAKRQAVFQAGRLGETKESTPERSLYDILYGPGIPLNQEGTGQQRTERELQK